MNGRSNNHIKRFFNILKLTVAVLAAFLIVSCPSPMTDELLAEVEDLAAPIITITSPGAVADDDLFINNIVITGIVIDYSDEKGNIDGKIQSLTYHEKNGPLFEGEVVLNSDGSFIIDQNIDNPNHPYLFGGLFVILDAVDWNGNSSNEEVAFFAFGEPIITSVTINSLDSMTAGYNDYSSNPVGLKNTLLFEGNATSFANEVKYQIAHGGGIEYSSAGDVTLDDSTGNFSFIIDPAGLGISGELVITMTSSTEASDEDTEIITLTDHPSPPTISSSQISNDNDIITITYSAPVYHNGLTAPLFSDFTYLFAANGSTATAAVSGFEVTPVAGDTTIQFSVTSSDNPWTPNGDETIEISPSGTAGYILADWSGNPVTATGSVSLRDKKGPAVINVTATNSSGAYNADDDIFVTVEFDDNATASGIPSIALNSSLTASAIYSSGSGSTILTFTYDIASGDNIPTLDYDDISSLALNGTLVDGAGNGADETLPALGGGSSLAQRNITIDTDPPNAPINFAGTTPTNSDPSWSWAPGGEGNGTYRHSYDDANWTQIGTTSYTDTDVSGDGLDDADYTLYVQERDAAGNWSPSGSYIIKYDTVGPTITITDPGTIGSSTALTVTATDPAPDSGVNTGSYSWVQTGGGGGSNNEVSFSSTTVLEPTINVPGFLDDDYVLELTAYDLAGNPSSEPITITWDDGPVLTDIEFEDVGNTPGADDDDTITFYFDEAINPATIDGDLGVGPSGDITNKSLAYYLAALGSFPGDTFTTVTGDDSVMRYDNSPARVKITLGTTTNGSQPSVDFVADTDIQGTDGNSIHHSNAVTPTGTWDDDDPVTDSDLDPSPPVYSSPQTVTLTSSSDAEVIYFYYSVNGTPTVTLTEYLSPITLTLVGGVSTTYSFSFYAEDLYGNIEDVQTESYVLIP